MVTGPMPRKPKATRPKANTAGAIIKCVAQACRSRSSRRMPISAVTTMPIQKALKLPAVRPEQHVQRGAALARSRDHLGHVPESRSR